MHSFHEYAVAARRTARPTTTIYLSNALAGEVGEFCNEVKKWSRDDNEVFTPERREKMALELGDCLWYLTQAAEHIGYDLSVIAAMNIRKLEQRHGLNVETNTSTQRTA